MTTAKEAATDLRETHAEEIYAPDWVIKDAPSLKRDADTSPLFDPSGNPASQLERLSDSVSALIFPHLTLEEIVNLSLVSKCLRKACRSQELWKNLMTYRWNLKKNDQRVSDYYSAYRNAHQNPHDLWITHWNIAFPCDGVAPGRCCIPEEQTSRRRRRRKRVSNNNNPLKACPVCRSWSESDKSVSDNVIPIIKTQGQAMALSTCLTRQKCLNPPANLDECPSPHAAKQAFACAGTFHRKLKTDQYKSDSTHFSTDLLFFNLTDPCTEAGQWELNQLLREALSETVDHGINSIPARDPMHETSHHSWYICRLSNPDFYRPLVFQTGIQRPECFTVFPSEGYIEPGESVFLTVGIRPLGSALAYAFDALNVQREGLPAAWADLYTDEAHLPMAPILIRYKYAAVHPSRVDLLHDPRRRQYYDERLHHSENVDHTTGKSDIGSQLEYYWKQPTTIHDVRTIHLSVHVHSHYSFSDFSTAACQPWNWESYNSGPLFNSPELREHYFDIYSKINNPTSGSENGSEDSVLSHYRLGSSHSEEPCFECGRAWGLREEELAQAYFVHHNDAAQHIEKRRIILRNSLRCLLRMSEGDGVFRKASRHSQLLVAMTNVLHSVKAAPWATKQQKQRVLQIEGIVDSTYRQIRVGAAEDWSTWRNAGIYRFALCTDTVFQGHNLENHTIDADYKDEPDYLDAFRHLAHSPGHYCLGPQEDPNHLTEAVVASSRRYCRIQKGSATDLFMDNPVFAFQVGICMIRDPRSLLVHGIYDRIKYPGTVVRRPRLCCLDLIKPKAIRAISSHHSRIASLPETRQSYFILQEYLDLDTIVMLRGPGKTLKSNIRPRSLIIYTGGIPPPGVGQFPLSQNSSISPTGLVNPINLNIDDDKNVVHEPSRRLEHTRGAVMTRPPVAFPNDRGPQIFRLLWVLGAQLGLAVIDSPDDSAVFVDRNILIASQWVSISLMAAPLFWTLCARFFRLIPSQPINYSLEDLPFQLSNKMRFLTEKECGYFAIVLLFVWLSLGRWTERHVGRDFFRSMLEHVTPATKKIENMTRVQRLRARMLEWLQRHWDFCCPLFLQRRVFAPHWNRRSRDDLFKHIAFWKSLRLDEGRKHAQPSVRDGAWLDNGHDALCDVSWNDCSTTKVVVGSIVAMGSFCSSSPHFWLNLVTIFSCSISLGMSISLHSMEKGRPGVNVNSTDSLLKSINLATVVIWAFLIGQLVGSSGGTLFLAEFVVTSISLILGGAGTISTGAMESWGCFFCLSSTAFWGYLFGRVALMDGVRQKRGGYSSLLLSKAVLFLFFFWGLVFCVINFPSPASLMVVSPQIPAEARSPRDKLAAKLLQ